MAGPKQKLPIYEKYRSVCKICLKTDENELYVMTESYEKQIFVLFGVQFPQTDKTKMLCQPCAFQLFKAANLKEQLELSTKFLDTIRKMEEASKQKAPPGLAKIARPRRTQALGIRKPKGKSQPKSASSMYNVIEVKEPFKNVSTSRRPGPKCSKLKTSSPPARSKWMAFETVFLSSDESDTCL